MTKTKRIIGMVLGILFIGLCVSFLRLSQFGVDPFSAMNLGISGFIGWSFGTWQLLINAIILVVVFFQARSCIGVGTIINMIFVGYIADFICYVANDVVQIQMNLPLRIIALLLAQLMASMGVALYMVANMGIAPYDSVATIIEKLTHQKIPFHKARITIHQFLQGSYPERIRAFLFHIIRFIVPPQAGLCQFPAALAFFREKVELRKEALKQYAEQYDPLTIDTANDRMSRSFEWVMQPWPWEVNRKGGC